jgi:hypothetical protein
MTNFLKVSVQETIYILSDRGWSRRRVAHELGVDHETVGRYLRLRVKPAISTAGSGEVSDSKPAISIPGKGAGRKSQCEPLREAIVAKIEAGLTKQPAPERSASSWIEPKSGINGPSLRAALQRLR